MAPQGPPGWFIQRTDTPGATKQPVGFTDGYWVMRHICPGLFRRFQTEPSSVCGATVPTYAHGKHANKYGANATVDCGQKSYEGLNGKRHFYPDAANRPASEEVAPAAAVMTLCSTVCMSDPSQRCCAVPLVYSGPSRPQVHPCPRASRAPPPFGASDIACALRCRAPSIG